MASHRRARPRITQSATGRTLALTVAAAAAALTASAANGSAVAASPNSPQQSPRQASDRLDALYEQAEQAGQRYDGTRQQEQELEHQVGEVQSRIAAEQGQLNETVQQLGDLAGAQYRDGAVPPAFQLVFDAHPEDYLQRADALDRADARTAEELRALEEQQRRLDRDRSAAEDQLARLERLRASLAAAKSDIQRRLGAARALLSSMDAAQRSQLAAAEGAVAGPAAQAAYAALAAAGGEAPADGRAAAAVAAVRTALGRPYVYGSTGPGTFDCSGLMYWAWRHAGVTLPRTSQEQAAAGRRIPLSQARPGDLVIYYGDMHHVGMYVGNGMVIHAPHPGAAVRYERAASMPVAAVVRV